MRVAVIGGGPSGLVQLKCLLEAQNRFGVDIEARLFESHDAIGGIFYHHTYEEGEMVSSKFLTAFSDFRPRSNDADFFSTERYIEYLNDYATTFGLWPHIHLSTAVTSVRRGQSSEHTIVYQKKDEAAVEWDCDAVAVCAGVHAKPSIPDIPGIEHVPVVMHSEQFKSRKQFGSDKTIVIVGSGETGADIAYLAITSETKKVVFCHRDGWMGTPKRITGQNFLPWLFGSKQRPYPEVPHDVSQFTLFDTMYVHPIVRDSMIIWDFYTYGILPFGSWLVSGTTNGVDMWVGQVVGERNNFSRLFFNKAWQRISNHVAFPYRPQKWSLATRVRKFFFNTEIPDPNRLIDVAPFPTHISKDGVAHFPRNGRLDAERIQEQVVKPDVLIFATGYLPSFPFLNQANNKDQKPYYTAFEANVRNIWNQDDPTVGFIGFVRPGFGAIPPLAEMQSMMFVSHLLGQIQTPLDPDDEWHYRILSKPGARVQYGVEHDSYAYQLAKDMECAASFWEVVRMSLFSSRPWRLPWIWAAGASFNTKFRLRGPWQWDGALDVMTGELWETIQRREGLFGNFSLSFLPMCYLGSINLACWLYASFWSACCFLKLSRPYKRRIEPKLITESMLAR